MSLLLHGVVRASHPTAASLATVVTWQDLAMVVSGTGAPTQQDALAHLEMLSQLVLSGPVVPLRFGTTADSEDTVRDEVLAGTAASLRAHLDRLDGVVELHAYLRFDEDEALRAVHEERRPEWRSGGGLDLSTRIRLGEQVANELVTWRRSRSDALLAPVAAVAREQVRLPDREHAEERRALLVPVEEIDTARATITALRGTAGVDATCVGPLPAYNFLTEQAETSGSRWGW